MPVREKESAFKTSRRELSEDVPFGIGTLVVIEQSSVENCFWYLICFPRSIIFGRRV